MKIFTRWQAMLNLLSLGLIAFLFLQKINYIKKSHHQDTLERSNLSFNHSDKITQQNLGYILGLNSLNHAARKRMLVDFMLSENLKTHRPYPLDPVAMNEMQFDDLSNLFYTLFSSDIHKWFNLNEIKDEDKPTAVVNAIIPENLNFDHCFYAGFMKYYEVAGIPRIRLMFSLPGNHVGIYDPERNTIFLVVGRYPYIAKRYDYLKIILVDELSHAQQFSQNPAYYWANALIFKSPTILTSLLNQSLSNYYDNLVYERFSLSIEYEAHKVISPSLLYQLRESPLEP